MHLNTLNKMLSLSFFPTLTNSNTYTVPSRTHTHTLSLIHTHTNIISFFLTSTSHSHTFSNIHTQILFISHSLSLSFSLSLSLSLFPPSAYKIGNHFSPPHRTRYFFRWWAHFSLLSGENQGLNILMLINFNIVLSLIMTHFDRSFTSSFSLLSTLHRLKVSIVYPCSQFHQHFMRAFFVWKCFTQLFSSYVFALQFSGAKISPKKAQVKCWWNWHLRF